MATLIANLVRALLAALAAGVLPGYCWAGFVRRPGGLAERLAYSAALSMASVPALALVLSWLFGTGVTLLVAVVSVLIVFGSGALALRLRGPATDPAGPALPRPQPIRDGRALALIIVATGLALAVAFGLPAPDWLLIVILVAAAGAGLLAAGGPGQAGEGQAAGQAAWPAAGRPAAPAEGPAGPDGSGPDRSGPDRSGPDRSGPDRSGPDRSGPDRWGPDRWGLGGRNRRDWGLRRAWRGWALAAILALTAARAYTGVIWHDWPNLRGQDMFSHAVMTEQMLAHGSYGSYLIYPPGLSTMSAVICRLCGLPPLPMFAAAAPALLLLTTLAAYALATRLWGKSFGLVAAALSGLVLVGPYVSFAGGLYPDLLAAFFFMVMTVAGLVTFFQSPTLRAGLLVVLTGAAVVLYHSVGTEYVALLLGSAALLCLPYLFARGAAGRDLGRALIVALACAGFLSLAYAWRTYGLGELTGRGATTRAQVGLDMGSQPVLRAGDLLDWVGSPVIWLGVLGFAVLAVLVLRQLRQPGQVASALTVLAWCATMYAGSRTAIDGFPQRFERDVGAPLSILAALGLGLILMSLLELWRARRVAAEPSRALAGTASAGAELAGARAGGVVLASIMVAAAAAGAAGDGESSGSADSAAGAGARMSAEASGNEPAGSTATATVADAPAASTSARSGSGAPGSRADGSGADGAAAAEAVTGAGSARWPGEPGDARLVKVWSRPARRALAFAAAAAVLVACGVQAGHDIASDSQPSREVLPPAVAAAGAWLRQHNTGGTIISTPDLNRGLTNRAVLAMGGYTGLQAYPLDKIIHPRSLPTAGRRPLLDSRMVLLYPADCQSPRIVAAEQVRYIFLYRHGNQANFDAFAASPDWYRPVFANSDVLIYAPVPGASC